MTLYSLDRRPQGYFEGVEMAMDEDHGVEWIVGEVDEKDAYYIALEYAHVSAVIHVEIPKWSVSVAREALTDWAFLLGILRGHGIKKVLVVKKDPNPTFIKFIKMFGFSEPERLTVSQLEI